MIKLINVNKYFNKKKPNEIHVIKDTSLELGDSGLVALLGKSGSGKTTLLNVISGLDDYESGSIIIDGIDMGNNRDKWDDVRAKKIGYIFQDYYLHEDKSVYDNLELSLKLAGQSDRMLINQRIDYALNLVGMGKYKKRTPNTLSGGQKQRIGIARAIVKGASIIIADEPTGNLDSDNTYEIMQILKDISKTSLVILVTHEKTLAGKFADRIINLRDGKIYEDYLNECDYSGQKLSDIDKKILSPIVNNDKVAVIDMFSALKAAWKNNRLTPLKNKIVRNLLLFSFGLAFTFFICIIFSILYFAEFDYKDNKDLYYYRFTQQAFSLPPDGTNGIDKVLSSGNLYLEDFINCNSFDEDNVSISARDYFYSEIIIYPMDYLKKDAKLMYGKMPSKQYEILIDIRSAEEMKRYLKNYGIDDINYVLQEKVKIGNNTYTITGIADGGYTGGWLLEEDYQSISRSNVAAFLINDKDSFMAWADENNLSVYNKYDEVNVDSNLPIFLAGLIIIFLFLFLISISAIKSKFINNIKTIGINRCLGVKKRELAKEFICESIITLNFSALIGIIASIILEFIINFIYADELIIKGFQVILSILSIYTVYITLTIRNLYNLLRSTPAQIMTKYDL